VGVPDSNKPLLEIVRVYFLFLKFNELNPVLLC